MDNEEMLKSKISLLEEEIECTHMGLDALRVPRNSPKGTVYNLLERITYLKKTHVRHLSEIKTSFQNGINPYENE